MLEDWLTHWGWGEGGGELGQGNGLDEKGEENKDRGEGTKEGHLDSQIMGKQFYIT